MAFPSSCRRRLCLQRQQHQACVCSLLPVAPGKSIQPKLSLTDVCKARRVSLLLQNSDGAAAGVSHRHAGDFFRLWKSCNLSYQSMRAEAFYFCISAKVNEKLRFMLVAEASIEVFGKDSSLQAKEELAYFTDFCCHSCLRQRHKEAWSLTDKTSHCRYT